MSAQTQEEILTRRADLARARLLAVVDELDRKRHKLSHPLQLVARTSVKPIPIAIVGAAAAIAIGVLGFVIARSARKKQQQQRRWLIRRQPPEPSFWSDVANRTAKALTAFALVEAGKRAIRGSLRANAQRQ